MKRILCFCMVGFLLISFAGCNKEFTNVTGSGSAGQNASSNDRGAVTSVNTSQDASIGENLQKTQSGYPPLAENLQDMYQEAEMMAWAFELCQFQVDKTQTVTINGMSYYPIIDSRFPTYAKLQEYLSGLFTQEYIDTKLLTENGCVQQGPGGEAAMIDASGADDQTYAGHVFQVTAKNDQTIAFTATVYYADDVYTGQYFYTHPSNAGEFTTRDFNFQLDYTANGWRYSKFSYLR